ncbi:hypothetical protein ACEPAH_7992 [Sanghuangporus vaninii]
MSQTLVQRPTPVHDLSSREVIDVDDLVPSNAHNYADDDDIQFIARRPGRLAHEPIVIGDSDDDVEIVAGPSRPAPTPNARAQRNQQIHRPNRRVLFSPSPPPQDNYVPPVPPLPPRFGFAHDTPPLRYRPPPDVDLRGVVRPMEQPFRFEQGLPAQPQFPPVRDAHHNHEQEWFGVRHDAVHRPNITLGGGMLALNRRNQFEPAHPAPPRVENNGGWRGFLGGFGLAAYRMFFQAPDGSPGPERRDVDEDRDLLEALVLDAEERQPDLQFRLIHNPFGRRHGHQQPRQEEASYKPTFTHPVKPEPGFSNDFVSQEVITISDDPGPSSAHETGTTLVCAMCLDPLVMNVVGAGEEIRKSKLFALRCGHILDGKCIDSIMKPPPIPDQEDGEKNDKGPEGPETLSIKGKSRAKAEGIEPLFQASSESGFAARSKGKRRAVEPEDDDASAPSIPSKRKPEDSSTPEYYIRSRLRPRLRESGRSSAIATTYVEPIPASVLTGQFENGTAPAIDSSVPSRRSTRHGNRSIPDHDPVLHAIPSVRSIDHAAQPVARRRPGRPRAHGAKGRGRGKGKGKAPAVVIEAEYEWSCPVASCGHKHKSVRIGGVWRMDEQRGAIAMYV